MKGMRQFLLSEMIQIIIRLRHLQKIGSLLRKMGNDICCQQTTSQQRKQQVMITHISSNVSEAEESLKNQQLQHLEHLYQAKASLSENIQKVLNQHKPFYSQFDAQEGIKVQLYGKDVYEGPIDIINRPAKIGKMYKENGAFFIGNFVSGKAQGPCFYVMKDGSYYKGSMKNNFAQCENGQFISKDFQYIGGFQDNVFHGNGREKSLVSNYSFEGVYDLGKKKLGKMIWKDNQKEYVYEGPFDSNGNFSGKGKLIDPQGTYEGQFVKGEKHGYGVYFYKSQLRYEGYYSHNKKQGQGKLFNNDNTIAYKGVFKNGMPHGKGIATTKNGSEFQTEWIDGIDSRLL